MNRTETLYRPANGMNRWKKWPILCGLVGLSLAQASAAADEFYQNDGVVNYPGNVGYPPMIVATNFVNSGTFIIDFTTFSLGQQYYETADTLNYTNTGLMMCNSGFQFDTKSSTTGLRTRAANFNNTGSIYNHVASDNGGGNFQGQAECLVGATNIVNSGAMVVGNDGLIQFNGKKVDLTGAMLQIEGVGGGVAGSGEVGLNTNAWDPSKALGETFANSARLKKSPFILSLENSTPYIVGDADASVNKTFVIRAVFVQDDSGTNVTVNVYTNTAGQGLGQGSVTVEWVSSYQDVATGGTFNNYLYLNNDYVLGSSSRVRVNNGIPDNFTFTGSSTPLMFGQTPLTPLLPYFNVFVPGNITNNYSYVNAQMIASTTGTNTVANYSVTNLPGRVEVSAEQELDMTLAQVTGANYLSVQSPNQFNGTAGASIQVPYSDINVGATNGFLTISNLISSTLPNWSGSVQAWSTRWVFVDSGAITNDYRVLIVGSHLTPASLAQVQDMILHSTNSVVISDVFNIMRTFTDDSQNLTLTTNGLGNGAASLDGELNIQQNTYNWSASLPNMRNLTNNGAIRLASLAQFSGVSNSITVTPGTPAVAASGVLAEVDSTKNVSQGNKVVIGTNNYVFVNTLTNKVPCQVKIGTKFDGSMSNLIAAINGSAGAGTAYSTNTQAHSLVIAGPLSLTSHSFVVAARSVGTGGNSILTTNKVAPTLTWGGHMTLYGGANAVAGTTNVTGSTSLPYRNFINNGLVSDQGGRVWANNFVNSGTISNGSSLFQLNALAATLTNSSIVAGGDIYLTATNLLAHNTAIQAGKSLVLTVTNSLSDAGMGVSNFWSVGGAGGSGFNLMIKPKTGDLLNTFVTITANTNQNVVNIWSGVNRGADVVGYVNNAAVGWLVLNSSGTLPNIGRFTFNGTGASNALYVDCLELKGAAAIRDASGNVVSLAFNNNMVIYYAEAKINGVSVAEKLNHKNNDHLRWVPSYAGNFSTAVVIYPDGSTNYFNSALANSSDIDSNGNGIPNSVDPTPFFVSSQWQPVITFTNLPPPSSRVEWPTVPLATNYVEWSTNTIAWKPLTNFNYWYYGANVKVTNSTHVNYFVSPQSYPSGTTNVWLYDPYSPSMPTYYRITVQPWLTYPY